MAQKRTKKRKKKKKKQTLADGAETVEDGRGCRRESKRKTRIIKKDLEKK